MMSFRPFARMPDPARVQRLWILLPAMAGLLISWLCQLDPPAAGSAAGMLMEDRPQAGLALATPAPRPDQPEVLPSVQTRFAAEQIDEVPDFQRHVSPLLGRLGCNGRACHGSFQGQGGFRLSLFGYDFAADHTAIHADGAGRIDSADVAGSLLLSKPIDAEGHGGGQRFDPEGWQYRLLERWIRGGAQGVGTPVRLDRLEVTPAEIVFRKEAEQVPLRAIAHWSDGVVEDVTPLCRFQSNDPAIATIDEAGLVTAGQRGDSHVVVFYDNAVSPVPVLRSWNESQGAVAAGTLLSSDEEVTLDQLVQQKLDKLGLRRSEPADDAMFLRRVCLDLTGTLPSSQEVREFLADPAPDKRSRKIDELLETPAYAAWWATFLCDMTGNNSEQLRNGFNSESFAGLWYEWIRVRVADNLPYDQIVEGIVMAEGRAPDQSYEDYCSEVCAMVRSNDPGPLADQPGMPLYWMRRDFQSEDERANSFAHSFLGLQIQCAQCHKHPFDQWTQSDFQGFARFFSGVEVSRNGSSREDRAAATKMLEALGASPRSKNLQQVLREAMQKGATVPVPLLSVRTPRMSREKQKELMEATGKKVVNPAYRDAILPGGETVRFSGTMDIRQPLMDWLKRPDNPYFARAIVNRVWARYFGVGIINPPDDLNLANPPSNAELLDWLARSFVENGYDLKWLHREIANSRTYQTSWQPNETNGLDRRNFSRALPRRLPAEAVVDATEQASASSTGNRDFIRQLSGRAITVPGTAYGRPNDRNQSSGFALQIFGRSTRASGCDCDRSEETSLIQTVYLQNDRDMHFMLARNDGWVAEVAGQALDPAARQSAKAVSDLRSRLKRLERQLAAAREKETPEQATALERRIEGTRKQLATAEASFRTANAVQPFDESAARALVEEAYLRTVSRFPQPGEVERCLVYMREYPLLRDGLAGVLWSLINGSEFIVNH